MKKILLAILFLLGLAALGYWWMATYDLVDDTPVQTQINTLKDTVADYRNEKPRASTKNFEASFDDSNDPTNTTLTSLPDYVPATETLDTLEGEMDTITLNAPFTATISSQISDDGIVSALGIVKDGAAHVRYSEIASAINNRTLSADKARLYLSYAIQKNAEWFAAHQIITIDSKKAVDLPAKDCVSRYGSWEGAEYLITHGIEPETAGRYMTPVCAWRADGTLIAQMNANVYWTNNFGQFSVADQIGIPPQEEDLLWFYARSTADTCSLFVYNTATQKFAVEKPIADSLSSETSDAQLCRAAQFNFSDYNGTAESIGVQFIDDATVESAEFGSVE